MAVRRGMVRLRRGLMRRRIVIRPVPSRVHRNQFQIRAVFRMVLVAHRVRNIMVVRAVRRLHHVRLR